MDGDHDLWGNPADVHYVRAVCMYVCMNVCKWKPVLFLASANRVVGSLGLGGLVGGLVVLFSEELEGGGTGR